MEDQLSIVIPMKVWTPGLHGFRAKRLLTSRAMIPPHIELCSVARYGRGQLEERMGLSNRLAALRRSYATFSYRLASLEWQERERALCLYPEPLEPFQALREALMNILSIDEDPRSSHRMRLILAQSSDQSEYALREEFELMTGELVPLQCRATELEVYAKRSGDWLLRESHSLKESERN
ncbi:MAG: hypothetical protein CBD18_05120 [Opitutales bacterium TMED158]|nr:MAG: hypothetical protein CBD18_05120 [Opitutales bacterium TMED158]